MNAVTPSGAKNEIFSKQSKEAYGFPAKVTISTEPEQQIEGYIALRPYGTQARDVFPLTLEKARDWYGISGFTLG